MIRLQEDGATVARAESAPVKILVRVDKNGSYRAAGWSGATVAMLKHYLDPTSEELETSAVIRYVWVEATVPVPVEPTVEGSVTVVEAAED